MKHTDVFQASETSLPCPLPARAVFTAQLVMGSDQGLKKCKFPWKLIESSRRTRVENDRPFMTSHNEFVFLKTLHSRC